MRGKTRVAILLVLPALIILSLTTVFPLWYIGRLSFYVTDFLHNPVKFIGFRHYAEVILSPRFYHSVLMGLALVVTDIAVQLSLGLGAALLLNQNFRGRAVVRTAVLVPYVMPSAVAAGVWIYMFNDMNGILNYVLKELHIIESPLQWLTSPVAAFLMIVFVSSWILFPYMVIIVLAKLQTIPPQLYEAAEIDGASKWKSFTHITLPSLKPTLFVVITFRGIMLFNNFDFIWLLTAGGPSRATENLSVFMYETVFLRNNAGKGAALCILSFAILSLIFFLYYRVYRPEGM